MSSEHEPVQQQTDQLNSETKPTDQNLANKPQTNPLAPAETAVQGGTDKPQTDQLDSGKPQTDPLATAEPAPADQAESTKKTDKLGETATPADSSASGPDLSSLALTCPVCGLVNRPGELACSRCGTILAAGGTTRKLDADDEPPKPVSWPTGDVIVTGQAPIIFEIEGRELTVPVGETITIGRQSDVPDDSRPDVDLGEFGAGDKGVSRKHIKIKRKNILVYVADLGSTNGTLLNGRRLIPNAERLLRNGDELQLGRLKIKVKF